MIILGNRNRHVAFWVILFLSMLFLPVDLLGRIRLSIDSLFSGLLALTGFVFTARTFITFKLHEVVYGNPKYQTYVEKLRDEGAYNRELYDPLKELDTNLGNTTGMCLIALALFGAVALVPEFKSLSLNSTTSIPNVCGIFTEQNISIVGGNPGALRPLPVVILTDAAVIYFFFVLWQILRTTLSLNRNIHAIIEHWEKEYIDSQQDKSSVRGKPRR